MAHALRSGLLRGKNMICPVCKKHFDDNKKRAFANHHRWCSGIMEKTREKFRVSKIGERNVNWKGNDVGYGSLHEWVKNRLTEPERCEKCRKKKKLDLCNRSGKYLRRLDDWEWLCRRCHMVSDGRLTKFKLLRKRR